MPSRSQIITPARLHPSARQPVFFGLGSRRSAAFGSREVFLVFVLIASSAAAMIACGDSRSPRETHVTVDPPSPSPTSDPAPSKAAEPIAFVPRCADGDRTEQRHGATCLCCHSDEFGVGGSIDREGPAIARIIVTDARGDVATMAPNMFGNFFRHFTMTGPFRAVAEGPDGRAIAMKADAPSADCNVCHYRGGPVPLIHGP